MKRLLLIIALLLTLLAPSTLAQDTTEVFWKSGEPCCEEIYIDGFRIRFLTHKGITVGLFLMDVDGFYAAAVDVDNGRSERILVDPAQARLLIIGKKDKMTFLPALAPEKVVSKISGRHKWGNFFRSFAAGMATRRSTSETSESGNFQIYGQRGTTQGTYRGRATTTTTETDPEAQRRVAEVNAQLNAEAAEEAASLTSSVLRANTVLPQRNVNGVVFFERKKADNGGFSLLIGDTYFNFPVRFR